MFAQGFRKSDAAKKSRLFVFFQAGCIALLAALALQTAVLPEQAWALDTTKVTARPNTDSGSTVVGGKATRITWEAVATVDELLTSMTMEFPVGTTFNEETTLDRSTVNVITTSGLEAVEATFAIDGTTVTATFPWIRGGSEVRMQVFGVVFSTDGGDMPLTLSYTTYYTEDEVFTLEDQPLIAVEGVGLVQQISNWLNDQEWVQAWNSVPFLNLFLNPVLIVRSFPVVLQGFLMALGIVLCAFPAAIPVGMVLALMRISRSRFLRGLASFYVNVVRGTPLFLQIYIAFFGLPLAGLKLPFFLLGVIVLAMNSSAYMCEIFRAGIQSIPKGQFEASRSLGMTASQTMLSVIIPQMIRRVIPTLTSEFILLYKDTSLLAAVGVMEIIMYARSVVATTGSITPYIVAALFYLVITLPLAKIVGVAERKLSGTDGGTATPAPKKTRRAAATKGVLADAAAEAEAEAAAQLEADRAQVQRAEAGASAVAVAGLGTTGIGAIAGTVEDDDNNRGISPEQYSSL